MLMPFGLFITSSLHKVSFPEPLPLKGSKWRRASGASSGAGWDYSKLLLPGRRVLEELSWEELYRIIW